MPNGSLQRTRYRSPLSVVSLGPRCADPSSRGLPSARARGTTPVTALLRWATHRPHSSSRPPRLSRRLFLALSSSGAPSKHPRGSVVSVLPPGRVVPSPTFLNIHAPRCHCRAGAGGRQPSRPPSPCLRVRPSPSAATTPGPSGLPLQRPPFSSSPHAHGHPPPGTGAPPFRVLRPALPNGALQRTRLRSPLSGFR